MDSRSTVHEPCTRGHVHPSVHPSVRPSVRRGGCARACVRAWTRRVRSAVGGPRSSHADDLDDDLDDGRRSRRRRRRASSIDSSIHRNGRRTTETTTKRVSRPTIASHPKRRRALVEGEEACLALTAGFFILRGRRSAREGDAGEAARRSRERVDIEPVKRTGRRASRRSFARAER